MNLLLPLLLMGEMSAFLAAGLRFYLQIKGLDPVHWFVGVVPWELPFKLVWGFGVIIIVLSIWLFRGRTKNFMSCAARGAWPFLLLWIVAFLPVSFVSILLFIFISAWGTGNTLYHCGISIPDGEKYGRIAAVLSVLGGVAGCVWGAWMQFNAVACLRLVFSDWSIYVQAYQKLGGCFFSEPWALFTTGEHFNLLPNLIGALLFRLNPEPFSIFVLNSFVIYSTVPCAYFAVRSCKISPVHALIFSLSLLGHFTLANLNLCVFYGYHPNIYFMPLFLLCFGFLQQEKYKQAAVFMILTLLVQETFAVFWFGAGLMYLFFERGKKQKTGVVLLILMVLWFWGACRILMRFGEAEYAMNYRQMFHYSNLGLTVPEILLSPIQKPGVFFRELFGIENFYFAGMLLAGACASIFAPKYFVVLLPVFAGVALLNGSVLSNIAMQYQVEFFALLTAASAMGLAACRKVSPQKESAVLTAAVAGAVLCGCFVGRLPWGFHAYSEVKRFPDRSASIREFKKYIPEGKTLQTTFGYQAHFIGRNKLLDFAGKKILPEAEYVLLPNRDVMSEDEDLNNLFKQIQDEKKHRILLLDQTPGAEVFLLVRKDL